MPHRPILILKTGSTLPAIRARRGDFELWFADAMYLAADDWDCVNVAGGAGLPEVRHYRGVVVTGSPAMVTRREDWSEQAAAWLKDAVASGVPVLGVCYGHQLLAHALGGEVGATPGGREMGTVAVEMTRSQREDVLCHALPASFPAHMTHEESVLRLPPGSARLAATEQDGNAAFGMPGKRVWGVQFHPEFDSDIMRAYIEGRRDRLLDEGRRPDDMLKAVAETPAARSVLHRFTALCR